MNRLRANVNVTSRIVNIQQKAKILGTKRISAVYFIAEVHMKRFIQFLSFAFIAMVVSVAAVSAQSSQKFKADIPFDFSVGENTYAAGTYNVRVVKNSSYTGLLTLSDKDGKVLERLLVSPDAVSFGDESLFTFTRAGDKRFLTKISCAEAGYAVRISDKADRSAAKRSAEKTDMSTGL